MDDGVKFDGLKRMVMHLMHPKRWEEQVAASGLVELNIFPLKNAILFPGSLLPLHIFEDRYKAMTDDAVARKIPLAMMPTESGSVVALGTVCGGGKVTVLEEYPDKRKNIIIEGDARFRIREILQKEPFLKARAEQINDTPFADDTAETSALESLSRAVQRWVFTHPSLDDRLMQFLCIFEKPHHLADFIGGHFLPTAVAKQKLLEEPDRALRVASVAAFLEEEIARFVASNAGAASLVPPVPRSEMH